MAVNLIDVITQEFTGDTVSRIASAIGEAPASTERAIRGVVPAVVSALSSLAATPHGAGDVFRMFQQAPAAPAAAGAHGGNLTDLMTSGGSLASSLFGTRLSGIADWIASFAGIKPRSASSLLALAMPMVLGAIRRHAGTSAVNAGWLSSLLAGQQSYVRDTAPAGLESLLGLAGTGVGATVERAISSPPAAVTQGGLGWMKWALPLVALALIGLGIRGCNDAEVAVTRNATNAAASAAATAAATIRSIYGVDLGALVSRSLPNGIELRYPEKGVESQLVAFIQDPARPVSNDLWMTLDRIEFETGSATLRPSAQDQLGTLAGILKAFPNVAVKLGGYTDNVGDDAANMALSQARATNTMAELVRLGIPAGRVEAEGYGEQFPVATNDTEEGRQRNRRIDVRVTRK